MTLSIDDLSWVGPVEAPSLIPYPGEVSTPSPSPSGASTISKAERSAAAPASSRPQLPKPSHYMLGVIKAHQKLEEVARQQAELLEAETEEGTKEIEELEEEKRKKLQEHAAALASQKTWSALSATAQCLISGTEIALAVSLFQTAPLVGALLGASGVVGLTAHAMHELEITHKIASWYTESEELQGKISTWIETGMYLVSLGLGVAGGIVAWQSGASLWNTSGLLNKTLAGIGLTATVGKGLMELKKADIQKKDAFIQADVYALTTQGNWVNQKLAREANNTQGFLDATTRAGKKISGAMSSLLH